MRGWSVSLALVIASLGCSHKRESGPERPIRLEPPRPAEATYQKPMPAPTLSDLATDPALETVKLPAVDRNKTQTFRFGAQQRPGWYAKLPDAYQLPPAAYGAGKVYVSGGFETTTFYAFDAQSGRRAWTSQRLEDNGPTAAVFDEGRLVFNTESCTLMTLEASNGHKIWHKYLGDPTLTQAAVAEGLVFSSHPGRDGMKLSAYQLSSGGEAWTESIDGELLSAPIVSTDSVYITTVAGTAYRFLRKSGKPVWKRAVGAATAPWIAGDRVYLSVVEGKQELPAVLSAATGEVLASDGDFVGSAADVPRSSTDGKHVWAFEGSRPVVVDGVRYLALGGWIDASRIDTGRRVWGHRYAPREQERVFGAVAVAGSQVVVATKKGQLFGFERGSGKVAWAYDLGQTITAQPIVAAGWVYVTTTDGGVIGMSVGDATVDGWHMWGGDPHHDGPVATHSGAL